MKNIKSELVTIVGAPMIVSAISSPPILLSDKYGLVITEIYLKK